MARPSRSPTSPLRRALATSAPSCSCSSARDRPVNPQNHDPSPATRRLTSWSSRSRRRSRSRCDLSARSGKRPRRVPCSASVAESAATTASLDTGTTLSHWVEMIVAALQRTESRQRAQVPLADERRAIAGLLQQGGQGGMFRRQADIANGQWFFQPKRPFAAMRSMFGVLRSGRP